MSQSPAGGLLEVLQRVPDPRGRYGKRHPLSAMLAAVVCSTLCGFRGFQPAVQWLELHGPAMWHLLGFRRRPPVRQTYANVLAELDPELLESLLLEFVEQCGVSEVPPVPSATSASALTNAVNAVEPIDAENWDGKTLRGTRRGDQRAEQVLVRMQRVLGKILSSHAIPAHTNKTAVALELVKRLVLNGKLIVADAAYCQRELCEAILEPQGDYLVTVKGNQGDWAVRRRHAPYHDGNRDGAGGARLRGGVSRICVRDSLNAIRGLRGENQLRTLSVSQLHAPSDADDFQ